VYTSCDDYFIYYADSHLGGIYRLHLQGRNISQEKDQEEKQVARTAMGLPNFQFM
jgi:hypothetical protein